MARKRKHTEKKKRVLLYILSLGTLFSFILLLTISHLPDQKNTSPQQKKLKPTEKIEKKSVEESHDPGRKNNKKPITHYSNQKIKKPDRIIPTEKSKLRKKRAKIVIIIDDVGYEMDWDEKFFSFEIELTFAILPSLPKSIEYYHQILNKPNFDAILHLPMEPYHNKDPGPYAIYKTMEDIEIRKNLEQFFSQMPGLIGANNHMGSYVTEDKRIMSSVLSFMQIRELIWIDSLTTINSVASAVANEILFDIFTRDLFLDNENNFDYVVNQFKKLIHMARQKDYAIGIGHFNRKAFFDTLLYFSQRQDEYNIRFVKMNHIREIQ